jgi:alpha-galactosidase
MAREKIMRLSVNLIEQPNQSKSFTIRRKIIFTYWRNKTVRTAKLCFVLAAMVLTMAGLANQTSAQTALAATPPMGWNSWYHFFDKVTDKDVRDAADQIVASGMRDAGYTYVNIDDTWEGERDANGVLHPNSKFPDMKALANYVHSKGLKIGIYSTPGPKTCAGYEGSYGHEEQDAKMYAEWGIDFLKYDLCSFRKNMQEAHPGNEPEKMRMMIAAYEKMAKALKATGRPMVFSLCQYGVDATWEWAPALGANLWRTTDDILPNWDRIHSLLEMQAGLERYAGPGHWNDPDMLQVGNGKLSLYENRSNFTMWAILAAPLLAGNDLPHMKPEIRSILTNKEVIAIDQDKLGAQGERVYSEGEVEVWKKPLAGGGVAIAVLNTGSDRYSSHPFHLDLKRLGLHGTAKAKNLWTGSEIELKDNMPIELKSHDVLLVRVG